MNQVKNNNIIRRKLLLAVDSPLIINTLSSIIRGVFIDVDLYFVKSFIEIEQKLMVDSFDMLILHLPIEEKKQTEAIMNILKSNTSLPVLVWSQDLDYLPLQKLYRAGVKGILNRDATIIEIKKALADVHKGDIYIKEDYIRKFFSPEWKDDIPVEKLTIKEGNVVKLLMEGKSAVEISRLLIISTSFVSVLKKNIFSKLNVKNLLELEKIKKKIIYA